MKLEEKLLEQYFDVIEKNGNTENQIQEFLEENTIFIPMPFLLNHYLHMNCVISKFKLGNEFVTDFAYLTKSSDYWEFVLVELEDAKKKIFTNDKENIYFHSEFNHAYDQITSWKAYVNKNREAILHQIDKLRVPLNENSVRFKYVLVIGRNAEKNNSEKRRAMFAEKSDNDIRVMTYDSLVSQCESVPYNGEKIILSTWKEQGFKIKKLPKQEISTSLFAYLKPEYLKISERDIEILKEHFCQQRGIKRIKLPMKTNETEIAYAQRIKAAFQSVHIFITSDTEEDVGTIRNVFENWRNSQ